MEEYDITEVHGILIRRIQGLEHPDPCANGHYWQVFVPPGAPIACIYCGEEWQEQLDNSPQREEPDG